MAAPLFVYGTLRDPDLLALALRRPLAAGAMLPAAAPGFSTVRYPRRPYPALVRRPGGAAQGLALTDLTAFEQDLLDAYEGEEYRRELIPVMVAEELHEAFAYLPSIPIPADAPAWTLAGWQAEHKPAALASERAALEMLRMKLIAIRPH